eukprot:TRINITY_DN1018_c0_g1_i1.p1 TRINITY_DN1018_c0_g1~~TRINITY_DN1018_c0_g1_i1.p1  ORF type:complete len:541 (+),score=128.10 TRINITY_DN1018_c0_g1_i1:62-1684(+)
MSGSRDGMTDSSTEQKQQELASAASKAASMFKLQRVGSHMRLSRTSSKSSIGGSSSNSNIAAAAGGGGGGNDEDPMDSFVDPLPLQHIGSEILGEWFHLNSFQELAAHCHYSSDQYHQDDDEKGGRHTALAEVEAEELNVLKQQLEAHVDEYDLDEPIFNINLKRVQRRFFRWTSLFPSIKPYYAVKCNPDPAVVKTLALCGANFDCASIAEIALVLSAGVQASRIIFANPCKAEQAILYARSCQVTKMTFDNSEELEKISRLYPVGSELILRIATDDADASTVSLSSKFGADVDNAAGLLKDARRRGLKVVGISFHVGSGCHTAEAYRKAIQTVAELISANPDFDCRIVDIGGGYPGKEDDHDESLLEEIAVSVNQTVRECFGDMDPDKRPNVVAEPGRFFVQASHLLGTAIVSKRPHEHNSRGFYYTISEGIYGCFKDRVLVDEIFPPEILLSVSAQHGEDLKRLAASERLDSEDTAISTVVGPSGHKLDVICPSLDQKFSKLNVGDWLAFRDMGAYTLSISSCHYHHSVPHRIYCWI